MQYSKLTINCPVTMIIFNRYDNAKQVFEQVRKVQPPKLFIIADGPRASRPNEKELCEKTRSIVNEIDWPCEVITNFSDTNLGCRNRIATGLSWVFSLTDRSIILEDDCLPSTSFFFYCEQLLEKYIDNEQIMLISGDNHLFSDTPINESYYFTRHVHIWGWATWARAWSNYDLSLRKWPEEKKNNLLSKYFSNKAYKYYWESLFDAYKQHRIPSWDGAWVYSVWAKDGFAIAPKYNLIQNTGFTPDATHTTGDSIFATLQAHDLDFPLVHPDKIVIREDLDNLEMKLRCKEEHRLPYPLCKWASKSKHFILKILGKEKYYE